MIQFKMDKISIEQFAVLSETLPPDNTSLNIDTHLGFSVAEQSHLIATRMKFNFNTETQQLIILELTCQFKIIDNSWDYFVRGDKTVIPKEFLSHMAMHTVGTARGILFCKTEGSIFNTMILPPLNVAEMITEDLCLDVSQQ